MTASKRIARFSAPRKSQALIEWELKAERAEDPGGGHAWCPPCPSFIMAPARSRYAGDCARCHWPSEVHQ